MSTNPARRPVPSKAALRRLYQLAYISSGTAAGVATLWTEERRRRTHVVQTIADNARRLRGSERHVSHAAQTVREEREEKCLQTGGEGDLLQPDEWGDLGSRTRRRRKSEGRHLSGLVAGDYDLPSKVERGYRQVVGRDWKWTRRRVDGSDDIRHVSKAAATRPAPMKPTKIERLDGPLTGYTPFTNALPEAPGEKSHSFFEASKALVEAPNTPDATDGTVHASLEASEALIETPQRPDATDDSSHGSLKASEALVETPKMPHAPLAGVPPLEETQETCIGQATPLPLPTRGRDKEADVVFRTFTRDPSSTLRTTDPVGAVEKSSTEADAQPVFLTLKRPAEPRSDNLDISAEISARPQDLPFRPVRFERTAQMVTRDVELFFKTVPRSSDPPGSKIIAATHLLRVTSRLGSLAEIRSLCYWLLVRNGLNDDILRRVCAAAARLAQRENREEVFAFYSEFLLDLSLKVDDASKVTTDAFFKMTLLVAADVLGWDLDAGYSARVRAILPPDKRNLPLKRRVASLCLTCERLVSAGHTERAYALQKVACMYWRIPKTATRHLQDDLFASALQKGLTSCCRNLLQDKFVDKSVPRQLDAFLVAVGRQEAYRSISSLLQKFNNGEWPETLIDELSPEAKHALARACLTERELPSFFARLYNAEGYPDALRVSLDDARTVARLHEIWKSTRDLSAVRLEYQEMRSGAVRESRLEMSVKAMDTTLVEIYNQANRADAALELLAQVAGHHFRDVRTMCLAAESLAMKADWERLDELLRVMAKCIDLDTHEKDITRLNRVVRLYLLQHSAADSWTFVTRLIKDMGLPIDRFTIIALLEACVQKKSIHFIPRWLEHLRNLGHKLTLDAEMAAKLLNRYYLDQRPPHVILMWLCRNLARRAPIFDRADFVIVLKEALAADLRKADAQDKSALRARTERDLVMLRTAWDETGSLAELDPSRIGVVYDVPPEDAADSFREVDDNGFEVSQDLKDHSTEGFDDHRVNSLARESYETFAVSLYDPEDVLWTQALGYQGHGLTTPKPDDEEETTDALIHHPNTYEDDQKSSFYDPVNWEDRLSGPANVEIRGDPSTLPKLWDKNDALRAPVPASSSSGNLERMTSKPIGDAQAMSEIDHASNTDTDFPVATISTTLELDSGLRGEMDGRRVPSTYASADCTEKFDDDLTGSDVGLSSLREQYEALEYHPHTEYQLFGKSRRGIKRVARDMILALSQRNYQKTLEIYQDTLAEGLPASPIILEVAVEACVRLNQGHPDAAVALVDAARDAGFNTGGAMGPLLINRMLHLSSADRKDANALRVMVIDYYRLNDEAGLPVTHHVGVTAANVLIRNHRAHHGINILTAIYHSDWVRDRPLDLAAMTVFLKGYAALSSWAGVIWALETVRGKDMRIDRKFVNTIRDCAIEFNQRARSQTAEAARLEQWRVFFGQRRLRQRIESKEFGNELVHCLVRCVEEEREAYRTRYHQPVDETPA